MKAALGMTKFPDSFANAANTGGQPPPNNPRPDNRRGFAITNHLTAIALLVIIALLAAITYRQFPHYETQTLCFNHLLSTQSTLRSFESLEAAGWQETDWKTDSEGNATITFRRLKR